ncbi:MAG: acetolactate decarboxylase [Saprospiraceae bacterium]|nr:acetolactate decarboxylase [Saprospiraceae bacterium]
MKYFTFIILLLSAAGLAAQQVHTISEMRKVMMGQDLSAHLRWDTVAREHLFGISPLGRLEGEVTIVDGQPFVSTVDKKGRLRVKRTWKVEAPFGVYAQVPAWERIELEMPIRSESELQQALEGVLQHKGYDFSQPLPFHIQGAFERVDYHIISKPKGEIEHSHELHDKAKKHFTVQHIRGELLGFYSRHHEGIFTHRGSYVHIHFIDAPRKHAGHLEHVAIGQKFVLYLPASRVSNEVEK